MTHIKYGKLNVIVTGTPKTDNINDFINVIRRHHITDIVRACNLCYDDTLIKSLCSIHEYIFDDGQFPTDDIIWQWIKLLFIHFYEYKSIYAGYPILIHCHAGQGRAPLLVCIAIIVCENKDPLDAILIVRKFIKHALNNYQVDMLTKTDWKMYRNEFQKLVKKYNGKDSKCNIS